MRLFSDRRQLVALAALVGVFALLGYVAFGGFVTPLSQLPQAEARLH